MPENRRQPIPAATRGVVALLLLAPIAALLLVPAYARHEPELWGFPFFYWYQLLWMFLETSMTYLAYVLVQRARRQR